MKRKAQEEMVGFVMIVVLVTVVLLIFLGLTLSRNTGNTKESTEVSQFLESAMQFTSDCAVGYIPAYARVGEVLGECRRNTPCLNGKSACESLNETLGNMITNSFQIGEDRPLKGYFLSSDYSGSVNASSGENIIEISKGACLGSKTGAEYLSPANPGVIITRLELCY